jgi:ABC-2 type transport system permease protein
VSAGPPTPATAGRLHDLGYRRYTGPRRVGSALWRVVARRGLRSALRQPLVIVTMVLSCGPLVVAAALVWVHSRTGELASHMGLSVEKIFLGVASAQRPFAFFAAMLVGASALGDDFRTGGVAFYFSRPVTRGVYLAGKLAPVVLLVGIIVTGPPLLLAFEYLSLGGGVAAVPLLFGSLLYGAAATVGLCAPAALISAMVRRRLMGAGLYFGLYAGSAVMGEIVARVLGERWPRVISLTTDIHVMAELSYRQPVEAPPLAAAAVLIAIVAGSLLWARARLSRVDLLE